MSNTCYETIPAGVHSLSDFATRDSCRQVIEEVARYSKRPELEVASEAMALAEAGRGHGERHHIGYYLLGAGRIALGIASGLPPSSWEENRTMGPEPSNALLSGKRCDDHGRHFIFGRSLVVGCGFARQH